jgi:hypothetical protein
MSHPAAPVTQGQAMARRRRVFRRIEHWHLQALRSLLAINRDPVAHLLLDQARIRLQLLATAETAAPLTGPAQTGTP